MAVKSSTNRLQETRLPTKKQESERVLKALQGIGVSRQTSLKYEKWLRRKIEEKENKLAIVSLCDFKI